MNPADWQRVKKVLEDALGLKPSERAAYLDEACSDPSFRREVESLIAAHDEAPGSFLTGPGIPAEETAIGDRLGSYEILARIGAGGMGVVYSATDTKLGRRVALKVLPPDMARSPVRLARFQREARSVAALNHPNIVTLYSIEEVDGTHFLTMELIEGKPLKQIIPESGLAFEELLPIAAAITEALTAAHDRGIIHRDLKPSNVMLTNEGRVKVLDFGLAKEIQPATSSNTALTGEGKTGEGPLLGTPAYMSPEQTRGESVTSASDIFSLGIIYYEMATGHHPFSSDSTVGYLHSIASRQPIPPSRIAPEIPVWFETLLLRMLEKQPDKRGTVTEVALAFREQGSQHGSSGKLSDRPVFAPSRRTVGREKERAELHACFQSVRGGRGSFLCISGEPGQGKTTLVEEFLTDLLSDGEALVARGRCSERLAGAEAYLPILETLESLMNAVEREAVAAAMKTLAPTWYGLLSPASVVQQGAGAPSSEKLKRQLAALLEEISRQHPLVLFIDDVHWADVSTVDLLAYLSTKLDRIRALIVVSYRAPELHATNHPFLPLQLEMETRGICREITLGFLSPQEIRQYIDGQFPGHAFPDEFVRMIHERTEGNPLFAADLLRYLQERKAIRLQDDRWMLATPIADMLTDLPESVRSMVQRKMEQLGEYERKLLTAASVQGADFEAAVVAKALGADPADVEESLEKLEKKSGFVRLIGEHEYPDRGLTLRFRFVHALYQNAFYAVLRPSRRISLSKLVADALMQFHGAQAAKIAAQLALLFEMARDFDCASGYYQTAAQNALKLFASHEGEALARRGLTLVKSMPDGAERNRKELGLQSTLASALRDRKSHASGESLETHRRVQELSQQTGDPLTAFIGQVGMFWFAFASSDFAKAREQAELCLQSAEEKGDSGLIMHAHYMLAHVIFHMGEHVECDLRIRKAIALYDPAQHAKLVEAFGIDVRVNGTALLGLNLWYLGFADQARAKVRESIEIARTVPHPVPLTLALVMQTFLYDFLGDPRIMQEGSQEVIAIAVKHNLQANTLFWGKFGTGWALAKLGKTEEGWVEMRAATADAQAMGMTYAVPTLGWALAGSLAQNGRPAEALALIDRYLPKVEQSGPRDKLSELYRLKGELLLGQDLQTEAEMLFESALDAARQSGALAHELRAAVSLARLYLKTGEPAAGRRILPPVFARFTEGFDTPDLLEAKVLIRKLSEETANASSV